MAIFKYTLPSGSNYVVEAPAGTTQEQADYVFYSQVASGSLVGYAVGQTLSSAETRLTKFALSRLDRGTAGVDVLTVLAISSGSPVVAPTPNLINVPLQSPISAADYALTGPVNPVGPLTPEQTQAVVAQIGNLVDQPVDTGTAATGVGTYGITPAALENAGYLKPGTSNYPNLDCAISSPSVWTGKNGVYSLIEVLGNPDIQKTIQSEVMQNSYDALTASGTIQTTSTTSPSITSGQIYTAAGTLATLTAPALVAGTAALAGNFNSLVTNAFAGAGNISSLLSNPVENISTIASGAVNGITQSVSNLGSNLLTSANNIVSGTLNGLTGQASSLINNTLGTATNALNSITGGAASTVSSLAGGLTTAVNGSIGGLVANASQFGAPVAALWSQGSGALNSALSSASGLASGALNTVTGTIDGVLSTATGAISGAVGELTNLASGALSSITGQASELLASLGGSLDIFGKMSSFSIDFSLFSSDALVSPTKVAAGFSNTVDRQTVDAAVQRILGNAKIPTPKFEYPSASAASLAADIQAAQAALKNLTGQVTGAVTSATAGVQSAFNNLIG